MSLPNRLAALAADRERVYRVVAYSEPPRHLCMAVDPDGRWYRRGTGAYVVEVARALKAARIRGVIRQEFEYLAGTPFYQPPIRERPEPKDRRDGSPVEFAQMWLKAQKRKNAPKKGFRKAA